MSPTSALVLAVLLLAAPLGGQEPRAAEPEREEVFSDQVSVELIEIVARVLDPQGAPLVGLGADDFQVRVGRQEVPVRALDWIGGSSSEPGAARLAGQRARGPIAGGRLMVFFVQADVNSVRTKGHLRMLDFTGELIGALGPEDLAAVVEFDSHLKLWQDFTSEPRQLQAALERAVRFGGDSPLQRPGRPPSLARRLHVETGRKASTPEQGLLALGRALEGFGGEKVVIYLGWGLGRFGSSGLRNTPDYRPALEALQTARASVFVLDVTDADYHTLEISLAKVAEATGGTYAKTNKFAEQATKRLARTLAGHYVLTLDRRELPAGGGKLQIELRGGRGEVLFRREGF